MSHWRTLRIRIAPAAGAMEHQQVSRRVSAIMRIFYGVRYPWRNVEKKRCAFNLEKESKWCTAGKCKYTTVAVHWGSRLVLLTASERG